LKSCIIFQGLCSFQVCSRGGIYFAGVDEKPLIIFLNTDINGVELYMVGAFFTWSRIV
jgi:hypothetical protein